MSTQNQTAERPPYVLAHAEVRTVERVSPNFVRIGLGGPEISDIGTPGDIFDARIKLVFPPESGVLPTLDITGRDWYSAWLAVPEGERGSMRTYSIRALETGEDGEDLLIIDFVLHLEPGLSGPAARWANAATPGDELLLVGPRRGRSERSGIEYDPGAAARVLLAGDETAAPAIARILEDAPAETRGIAFIEVPLAEDALPIRAPEGVEVHWLPRGDVAHGLRLIPTVLDYLGAPTDVVVRDVETEALLWETPVYSGLGEDVSGEGPAGDRYFWIAGESGVVTTLRRHVVRDLGVDRSQVAFMGYWRRGVTMRG